MDIYLEMKNAVSYAFWLTTCSHKDKYPNHGEWSSTTQFNLPEQLNSIACNEFFGFSLKSLSLLTDYQHKLIKRAAWNLHERGSWMEEYNEK